jgi:hypothetical protein
MKGTRKPIGLRGKWRAQLEIKRKALRIGLFDSEEEAAQAYQVANSFLNGCEDRNDATLNTAKEVASYVVDFNSLYLKPQSMGVFPQLSGKFRATVYSAHKFWYIGVFDLYNEAAIAYQIACKRVDNFERGKPDKHFKVICDTAKACASAVPPIVETSTIKKRSQKKATNTSEIKTKSKAKYV